MPTNTLKMDHTGTEWARKSENQWVQFIYWLIIKLMEIGGQIKTFLCFSLFILDSVFAGDHFTNNSESNFSCTTKFSSHNKMGHELRQFTNILQVILLLKDA